ncbi:hypothetical protein CDAR_214511 [Caerostris darwini]|uniref:Uncharacterized protein n=1 Tax=Caerostris darwini TaxID=1538125 RepID=A0AAV4QLX5_9ARAC|nr:hypothetical protein CDAR_214511 [Caerostris darwini]
MQFKPHNHLLLLGVTYGTRSTKEPATIRERKPNLMYLTSAFAEKSGIYVRLGKILSFSTNSVFQSPMAFTGAPFLRVGIVYFFYDSSPGPYQLLWDMLYHTKEKKEVLG